MTRINLVPPKLLTDQHLMAEIKEINQLAGQFRKSINSKSGVNIDSIPSAFCLGTGHVKFFYNKGKFLRERFADLKRMAIFRGINIKADFKDEWESMPEVWNQDYQATQDAYQASLDRILDRVAAKPEWYRWCGQKIDYGDYKRVCGQLSSYIMKEAV